MNQVVITIARQYGSGGRTVGKMLAERLGISFYDKQIIQMASDESGIDVKLFGKVEEGDKVKGSLFGNKESIYKGNLHQPGSKEFIGKLISSQLEAVINAPENEIVYGLVDGNLMWRVLSNLLSNACKYSQPNTRVYIQIKQNADLVFITVKNISRNQLNIDPDELMERFVRGDSSRSTEGSGLGLNIARSLVELQKGKFFLSIDGDLFKAQIRFARASLPEAQTNPEETTAEN